METDARLAVYAQWGDRMAEDLRHEVTHGYLHSVVPDVPQWLDEGIAKFYEVPRGQRGLNCPLFDRLLVKLAARALAAQPAATRTVFAHLQHDAGRLRGGVGVERTCCWSRGRSVWRHLRATWPRRITRARQRRFPSG